jgi:LAS superfamily LD-carboxypeptidase LdcB
MSVPASPAKAVVNEIAAPNISAPAFPFREHLPTAVERLSLVPDDQHLPSVPKTLAAPREGVLVRKPSSRSHERAVLPGCTGEFPLLKVDNGRLPQSMLCTLWDGKHELRADAAVSLAKLNVAYTQEFGHPLCVSDGYRTLGEQYAVKAQRGWLAATAGTSNHGLGVATDLCDDVQNSGSRTHAWMVDNAPLYGWTNPDWAQRGGSGPFEPWHWEFTPPTEDGSTPTG